MKADRYRRVLLKISGEIFGSENVIFDSERIEKLALQLKEASESDIQIAIVVGGGNILRGAQYSVGNSDRCRADYMGMLATVINSLVLKSALEGIKADSEVLTAIPMEQVAELFTSHRALEYLKEGKILILAGGTGNPFFTTDTAAALRAAQIGAEAVLKGTKVDGIYDSDPVVNKDAEMIASLSYTDILERKLKVMDSTAVALCRENKIAITVFNILKNGNLKKVLEGKPMGTIVK
ncbi:MAG: UMP kinase [Candidatus Krumholzibacteriota bacterium]|nr:UMP kinase [Candidatus Krumholzibacteriota bacterium]